MKTLFKLTASVLLMLCSGVAGLAAEAQWEHRPAHADYGKLFPRGHILDVELENLSVSALAYLQSLAVTQNISSATITTGSGTVTNTLTAGTLSATTVTGAVVNAGALNLGGSNLLTVVTNLVQANAPADHEHAADDTTSGTFPLARLPVAADGESSATKVVRADDSRLSGGSIDASDLFAFTNRIILRETVHYLVTGSNTNVAVDLNYAEHVIVADQSFQWYWTNKLTGTNYGKNFYVLITNTTGGNISFTNVVDTYSWVGNGGTAYAGDNEITGVFKDGRYRLYQDNATIAISQVESLEQRLTDVESTIEIQRAPAFETVSPGTYSATHRILQQDPSTLVYSTILLDDLPSSGGGTFAYDIEGTADTETNTVTVAWTDPSGVPINTTRKYTVEVFGTGPTNDVSYTLKATVANRGGTLTINTNQTSVMEDTDVSTSDASFQLSGSDTVLHVRGPDNGENMAWKFYGFHQSRTNHSTDTIPPAYEYVMDETTATETAGYSMNRKLRSAYAGAAFRVVREGDDEETDIGFSGDFVDAAAISTFGGTSNLFVRTIYDQSGNGWHIGQATMANRPQVYEGATQTITTSVGQNNKIAARFFNSDKRLASTGLSSTASFTYFVAIETTAHTSGRYVVQANSTSRGALLQSTAVANTWSINSGSSVNSGTGKTLGAFDGGLIRAYFNMGGDDSIAINDIAEEPGAAGGNTLAGFALGSTTAGANFYFTEALLFLEAVEGETVGDEAIIRENLRAFYTLF
jgi:hypothetical protein